MNGVTPNAMLTQRQQEILDFIRDRQRTEGVTPSTREIQEHFRLGSQTTVVDHLRALERKGMLQRRVPHQARSLVLTDGSREREIREIPVYGTIPAGLPTDERQEADGCISIDAETLRLPRGARVFALNVRGESMVGAGILPGDVVILEFREPQPNDIVAALMDGETTLKRFVVQEGKTFLQAENPNFPDLIPAQELIIQGVQIALLRVSKP